MRVSAQGIRRRRHGALAVEAAVVYGVLLILVLGLIVGGIGVFRYQQVACLAREGARWASLHGTDWETGTNSPKCTEQQIRDEAVLPYAAGMNSSSIAVQVQFVDRAANKSSAWDSVAHPPTSRDKANNLVSNRVHVTVTYQWLPGALLTGPINLTSTSEVAMWY